MAVLSKHSVDALRVMVEGLDASLGECIRSHKELMGVLEEGITTLEAGLAEG